MSTDIISRFLASLLDLGDDQVEILMLLWNVFKEIFLKNDTNILISTEKLPGPGIGIPFVDVVDKCWEEHIGSSVQKNPFLLDMNAHQFTRHRQWMQLKTDFLWKWLLLDNVSDTDFTWLHKFNDIIISKRFLAEGLEDLSKWRLQALNLLMLPIP